MNSWLDEPAAQQKQWDQIVESFIRLAKPFMDALQAEVEADVREYQKRFPDERVQVEQIQFGFQVLHLPRSGAGGVVLSVRVWVDPIAKEFVYHIPEAAGIGQRFPARVESTGLVLDFSRSGASIESLCSYILTPVLFPALCNDSGLQAYVKRQFGLG